MNKLDTLKNVRDILSELNTTTTTLRMKLYGAALSIDGELFAVNEPDVNFYHELFDLAHALNDALTAVEAQRDILRKL